MSKQLAFSAAISVMIMAVFLLYGAGLTPQTEPLRFTGLPMPQLSGFKTLLGL